MIEMRDGYCVDPKRSNLHATWTESDWLPGYSVQLYDVSGERICYDPRPEHCFTKWGAKRTARKMLRQRLDPPQKFRYSEHGVQMCYVYTGETGNLIGAVRRVRFGYITEREGVDDRWVPFRWVGLRLVRAS